MERDVVPEEFRLGKKDEELGRGVGEMLCSPNGEGGVRL